MLLHTPAPVITLLTRLQKNAVIENPILPIIFVHCPSSFDLIIQISFWIKLNLAANRMDEAELKVAAFVVRIGIHVCPSSSFPLFPLL